MISLEDFIKVNHGFLCQLANYFCQTYVPGLEFEDLYQVGCLALVEKYDEYNPDKGAISTFS